MPVADDCDFKAIEDPALPGPLHEPAEPRFCHIDLALSKDSAGVSIGHVPGFRHMNRGDYVETLPIIQFDMILEVRPPRGGEIEFENIRKLIYTLRDSMKVPIKWISFDQFQSRDSMQIMHQQGFMVGYQSMDIDTMAYDVTKQAFYDGRILAPLHAKARKEMITLEIDTKKNKIDHPPQGSKDVSEFDGRRGGRADHAARDLAPPPGADPAHPEIADREPGPDQGQPELHRAAARAA